jgi:chaperonin GroES
MRTQAVRRNAHGYFYFRRPLMYEYEPLYSRILVKRKTMEKTAGGIYIPDTSQEMRATEGEVVAVGAECTEIKPGEWVLYGRHAYKETELNGDKFDLLNEEDVLCRRKHTA